MGTYALGDEVLYAVDNIDYEKSLFKNVEVVVVRSNQHVSIPISKAMQNPCAAAICCTCSLYFSLPVWDVH